MRIWDIDPGYLNRQSLLGEHRELHAINSIIINNKKGYSQHPETLRWRDYGWALKQRHKLLTAEMTLRGYQEKSPVYLRANRDQWPQVYIDKPLSQIALLRKKYRNLDKGRILLPASPQQMWSQFKYSVMARDISLYRAIGRKVSRKLSKNGFDSLATELTEIMRSRPEPGGQRNALLHMWGYVADFDGRKGDPVHWPLQTLLFEIRSRALTNNVSYITSSTALGELQAWM